MEVIDFSRWSRDVLITTAMSWSIQVGMLLPTYPYQLSKTYCANWVTEVLFPSVICVALKIVHNIYSMSPITSRTATRPWQQARMVYYSIYAAHWSMDYSNVSPVYEQGRGGIRSELLKGRRDEDENRTYQAQNERENIQLPQ